MPLRSRQYIKFHSQISPVWHGSYWLWKPQSTRRGALLTVRVLDMYLNYTIEGRDTCPKVCNFQSCHTLLFRLNPCHRLGLTSFASPIQSHGNETEFLLHFLHTHLLIHHASCVNSWVHTNVKRKMAAFGRTNYAPPARRIRG